MLPLLPSVAHELLLLYKPLLSYSNNQVLELSSLLGIIQYSSSAYRDHKGLGFLVPKYHPKTSLIFTLWHLGRIG